MYTMEDAHSYKHKVCTLQVALNLGDGLKIVDHSVVTLG